jgi:hypothetical protein
VTLTALRTTARAIASQTVDHHDDRQSAEFTPRHPAAKRPNPTSKTMGQPSFEASNALIYVSYGAFLYEKGEAIFPPMSHPIIAFAQLRTNTLIFSPSRVLGTGIAWKMRNQSKGEFLAGNHSQTGQ